MKHMLLSCRICIERPRNSRPQVMNALTLDDFNMNANTVDVGCFETTAFALIAAPHAALPARTREASSVHTRKSWAMACHPESSFASPEADRAAASAFALPRGYALVRKSTLRDKNERRRRIVLGYDRHGSKQKYVSTAIHRRLNAATRKCGCPWR